MSAGWIKLHRCAEDHPALQNATRRGLFDRLLLRAARKLTRVNWRGRTVPLEVGQLVLSVREFAEKNEVGYKECRLHLARLEREGMLKMGAFQGAGSASIGTLVTICNYAAFQASGDDEGAREGAAQGAVGAQQGRTEQEGEKVKNSPTLTESVPEKKEGAGAPAPPAGYAFAAGRMRVRADQFALWKQNFPHIDVRAALQARHDWYMSPRKDKQGRTVEPGIPTDWFMATSNWLANRNEFARQRAAAAGAEEVAKKRARAGSMVITRDNPNPSDAWLAEINARGEAMWAAKEAAMAAAVMEAA